MSRIDRLDQLWTPAEREDARAKALAAALASFEKSGQETSGTVVPFRRQLPVRRLMALAAAVGVVSLGLVASFRLVRTSPPTTPTETADRLPSRDQMAQAEPPAKQKPSLTTQRPVGLLPTPTAAPPATERKRMLEEHARAVEMKIAQRKKKQRWMIELAKHGRWLTPK